MQGLDAEVPSGQGLVDDQPRQPAFLPLKLDGPRRSARSRELAHADMETHGQHSMRSLQSAPNGPTTAFSGIGSVSGRRSINRQMSLTLRRQEVGPSPLLWEIGVSSSDMA